MSYETMASFYSFIAAGDPVGFVHNRRIFDLSGHNKFVADDHTERLGVLSHELRNLINSASLAFEALASGSVGINGSTGVEQRGVDRTGLGLGLSICLGGVVANGGALRVRDVPGMGCLFTIDLPLS